MEDLFGGRDLFKRPPDPVPTPAGLLLTHRGGGAHHASLGPPPGPPLAVRDSAARLKAVRAKPYARGGSCRGGAMPRPAGPSDQLYDRMPAYLTSFSSGSLLPCHDKHDLAHAALTISARDLRPDADDDDEASPVTSPSPSSCSVPRLRQSSSLSRLEEIKRSEETEANERRIVFLGRLPQEWADPAAEIESILATHGLGPALRVVVKRRESGLLLDSYAFVYFPDAPSAHTALDFLQQHRRYRHFNVSFGGRDQFLLGQQYADLDSLPGAVASVCPTLNPEAVVASLSNGRGLAAAAAAPTAGSDFEELLRQHMRWQQHRRQD